MVPDPIYAENIIEKNCFQQKSDFFGEMIFGVNKADKKSKEIYLLFIFGKRKETQIENNSSSAHYETVSEEEDEEEEG